MFISGIKDRFGRFARRYTQLIAAVLYNLNIKGFFTGKIYQGDIKGLCAPGLNCYSCPGAVLSCPLGSLQSGLVSAGLKFPFYAVGTLLLFGLLLGRFICGFLCPFGFLQELIYKIPVPKLKKGKVTRILSYLKYVILVAFVIVIPLVKLAPGFCKYICPVGTFEGGIPLTIKNEALRPLLGFLFSWKMFILALVLLLCMFCFRAFCRFVCPLGAIYSLFNPISFFGVRVNMNKCIGCNKCARDCKLDVRKVCDRECVQCGECIGKCPTSAIGYGIRYKDFRRM
ncbi:MAG: 4Fe-4S binding protein [Lachnospiraceae bacterium]|nr:4Fe-4S binding protein [Lachnospiraceae bacterium]